MSEGTTQHIPKGGNMKNAILTKTAAGYRITNEHRNLVFQETPTRTGCLRSFRKHFPDWTVRDETGE
jgi:hypothetical protein